MAGAIEVAGLYLGLSARTDKLERDLAKARDQAKQFTEGVSRDAERASGFMEKLGLSGNEAKESFKNLTAGLLLSVGQVDGVNEHAKMLTQTLGAFVAGGPIAGGIVGLTSLFKFLAEDTGKSGEAAHAAAEEYRKLIDSINASVAASTKNIDDLDRKIRSLELKKFGIEVTPEELAREETAAKLRMDALNAMEEARKLQQFIDSTTSPDTEAHRSHLRELAGIGRINDAFGNEATGREQSIAQERLRLIEEANAARIKEADLIDAEIERLERVDKLQADIAESAKATTVASSKAADADQIWADTLKEMDESAKSLRDYMLDLFKEMDREVEAQQKIDDSVESIIEGYRQQLALAKATTDEERDRLTVLAAVKRAQEAGADWVQMEAIFDAGMAAAAAKRAAAAAAKAGPTAEKVGREIGGHISKGVGEGVEQTLPATLDPIFQNLGQTLFSGLGDALFDAITTGGRNAADIFKSTIDNMLRQTINSILNSGLQMLLSSLTGGGGGSGGIFSALIGGGASLLGGGGGGAIQNLSSSMGGGGGWADWIAGGAAPSLGAIPEIPALAGGGVVTSPTLALLGEGGEREYVIPESKMRRAGGGVSFGDIRISTSGDPERWKEEAVETFRARLNSSGAMQGAVRKATRGRY